MNCTVVQRYELTGRIYGDYIAGIVIEIFDEMAHLTRKNI
jgi:hypothetical protein